MTIKFIYGLIAIISLILIWGYFKLIKKKDMWFVFLFASVFVVNCGYFTMALSGSLEEALLANRLSYLGSVFLPLCMLMIIMNVCRVVYPKWLPYTLFIVSAVVFVIAASQGYTDWYYTDVSLTYIDGAAKLVKVYGPLHNVYYLYLLTYIVLMVGVIVVANLRKKVFNCKHASLLVCVTLGNIATWFIEQLIRIDFEFLSVSYIVTEVFLLMLYGLLQDHGIIDDLESVKEQLPVILGEPQEKTYNLEKIMKHHPELNELTARELEVLIPILQNKKRKTIADEFNVTEHTIKKHTAHIYSKLEVSNRKELHDKLRI